MCLVNIHTAILSIQAGGAFGRIVHKLCVHKCGAPCAFKQTGASAADQPARSRPVNQSHPQASSSSSSFVLHPLNPCSLKQAQHLSASKIIGTSAACTLMARLSCVHPGRLSGIAPPLEWGEQAAGAKLRPPLHTPIADSPSDFTVMLVILSYISNT